MFVPSVDVAVVAVAETWPEPGRRERDPAEPRSGTLGRSTIPKLLTSLLGTPEQRLLCSFLAVSRSNAKFFIKGLISL